MKTPSRHTRPYHLEAAEPKPAPKFIPVLEQAVADRDIEFATEIIAGQQDLDALSAVRWIQGRAEQLSDPEAVYWYQVIHAYLGNLLEGGVAYGAGRELEIAQSQAAAKVLGHETRSRFLAGG